MVSGDLSETLFADQEHTRLRAFVIFILILLLWVFFALTSIAIDQWAPFSVREFGTALSCIGALIFGLTIAWGIEFGLKKVWHSGLSVSLAPTGLVVKHKTAPRVIYDLNQNFMHLAWTYHLKGIQLTGRERRVSKSWEYLACQVQQDENRVTVYCYMPPPKAEKLIGNKLNQFRRLDLDLLSQEKSSRQQMSKLRVKPPKDLIAGKDGRFWLAEQDRWQAGMELTPDDFNKFLEHLMSFAT